jgi:hypothetical protein
MKCKINKFWDYNEKISKNKTKDKKKNKEIQRPKCTFAQLKNSKKKREMVPLSLFVKYDPFCFNFFNSQN